MFHLSFQIEVRNDGDGPGEVFQHAGDGHRRDLGVQPVVVEDDVVAQVRDPDGADQVVRQLTELAQVVPGCQIESLRERSS